MSGSSRHAVAMILITSLLIVSVGGTAMSQPPVGYFLGAGDLLEISVWGYPDLTRQVTVSPDGRVMLPLIGAISTAGLSTEYLTTLLTKAYAEYIIDPHVIVTVKEYRKLHASVLGQVARPGAYDLPVGTRLLDLIAAGGGPTEAAALKDVQLLRPGQSPVPVDLTRVMSGQPALNLPLAGGETLVVPEDLVSFVTVQGQVVRPGRYRLKGEMRVLDALMAAGGLTDHASLAEISLVRASGRTEPVLLGSLLVHQEMDRNLALEPGDIVSVPEDVNSKIYIIGDVRNPGVFPLRGQVTLLQAVAMAGGPEQRGPGTAKNAYVVRQGGTSQPPQIAAGPAQLSPLPNGRTLISADLSAIMHDPGKDIPVQPGDVVVLPMSGTAGFMTMVSTIAQLVWIFK